MASVWESLGYDRIAFEVADSMHSGVDLNVIQGPPGVGKSWLAKGIGAVWEARGGSTAVAQGDSLRSDVPLYPLGFAMAGLSSGWRSLGAPLADTARAGESLVGTSGLITETIRTLLKVRRRQRKARTMYLGEAEQQILFDFDRLSRSRPVLLIADNLHWWDSSSLEFISRLREPSMRDAFPFMGDMQILVVRTTEPHQHVANPAAHDSFLAVEQIRTFDLPRIPRQGFDRVLESLGGGANLDDEVVDAVYSLTGGHLALARRCAARMSEGEGQEFVSWVDTSEFVAKLLTQRIRSLGPLGTKAIELLQIAAVLGLRFRQDEIRCAWTGDALESSRLLRFCRDEDLVGISGEAGWFVHDLYRQHFLNIDAMERPAIHERLSDCLRVLSPGDYELRCQNAVHAELEREAGTLAVQAALVRQREGLDWRLMPPALIDALESAHMVPLVERLESALEHVNQYRYTECLALLDQLPHALPRPLLAEIDYLRATCLITTRSEQDRARGRAILEVWADYDAEEPELGIRMMQLLLNGLALVQDKAPGRSLEAHIKQVLSSRAGFDSAAEDALYTLDRCSSSLYEPDVSLIRTREAVEHFGPAETDTLVRRPVEYYRSMVNLGAELLIDGQYQAAQDTTGEIERLVSSYAPGTFPRLDYPQTNGLVAEFRLGLDPGRAVQRQQEIVDRHEVAGDPFYVENALGVYLAFAERFDESRLRFDRLLEILSLRRDPEPSSLYLLRANRCVVQFVAGDRAGVVDEWGELDEVVRRIPYTIGRFLVLRHELLTEVMRRDRPMTPQEFDLVLVRDVRPELGRQWDQLGRGFRLPEVQWWR